MLPEKDEPSPPSGVQSSSGEATVTESVEVSCPPGVLEGALVGSKEDKVLERVRQVAEMVALGKGIDEAAAAIGASDEERARITRHPEFSALIGAEIARHGDVKTRILAEAEESVRVLRELRDKKEYSKADETRRKIAEKFLALAGHVETKRSEKAVFHIPVSGKDRLVRGLRELEERSSGGE